MPVGLPDISRKVFGRMDTRPVRRFGLLLASLLSVSAYPALFVYFYNIREAVFAQVFPPILIFIAVGLAAWLFFGLLSGSMPKGACIALIFLLVFMNYSSIDAIIRSLVPEWRWWRIAPAFLFLFINLALALRVMVKGPEGEAACSKIAAIIGAVFLGLTLFNAASALCTLAGTPQEKNSPVTISDSPADKPMVGNTGGRLPNFYFFIFDEYARQDVLQKYTGYDNTPFLQGLERKKFNVSYATEAIASSTVIVTANLWQYSPKYKTVTKAQAGMKRPPLFDLFKRAGYKLYLLVPPVFLHKSFDENLIDVVLQSKTVLTALSITKTVLGRSFFACFKDTKHEFIRSDRLSLLQQAKQIIAVPAEQPKFMYFHLLSPHAPFVFEENGDLVAYENINDVQFYAGQLRFVSKKINELADTILEKDPHAVVLIQSDHGARGFTAMLEEEKLACLNTLYAGGQSLDIEGLSPINTLRLAINHALGLKLEFVRNGP